MMTKVKEFKGSMKFLFCFFLNFLSSQKGCLLIVTAGNFLYS